MPLLLSPSCWVSSPYQLVSFLPRLARSPGASPVGQNWPGLFSCRGHCPPTQSLEFQHSDHYKRNTSGPHPPANARQPLSWLPLGQVSCPFKQAMVRREHLWSRACGSGQRRCRQTTSCGLDHCPKCFSRRSFLRMWWIKYSKTSLKIFSHHYPLPPSQWCNENGSEQGFP